MALEDQLAQLRALGVDTSAIQAMPDVTRIGLVYVMADPMKRALPVTFCQRWGRVNNPAGAAGTYNGLQIDAGRRHVKLHQFHLEVDNMFWRLVLTADKRAFDSATIHVDAAFGVTEPDELSHVSRITAGRWTSSGAGGNPINWVPGEATIDDDRPSPIAGLEIFPGYTLEMVDQSPANAWISSFWFEEWGP